MSTDARQTEIRNRLGEETSLYLKQHADNPVAWQPWDEKALELARETGRPILLSIGYSACHWCHVMAHESFEDEETAGVMNALYVNIKVDREERPDLDKIYQLSHQLLSGRGGGWPLTLFLDPENQVPFFAGTYFPVQARYGMPAFKEILAKAREWFDQSPDEVQAQGERLQQAIKSMQRAPAGEAAKAIATTPDDRDAALIAQAGRDVLARFDRTHGGYGGAPKFPQAPLLELVSALGQSDLDGAAEIRNSLNSTLRSMARSGLRDHLDGGFFRYCVDGTWTIPHFEKMLYDNAQLLPLYAEEAARSGDTNLKQTAEGIVTWLQAEMLQGNGAFSASIDADADGVEGGFHVWKKKAVRELLGEAAYAEFARAYGLDEAPNFEGEAWHLVRDPGVPESTQLEKSRVMLREAREPRIHPTLDPKQLTSWNALMAAGLLRAARALGRNDWAALARDTLDFIRAQQWDGSRLLAVHNQGESRFSGYLDDYAFTLCALLESLQTDWRRQDLDFAIHLADALLLRFEDGDHGGFYFSDADQPTPIARSIVTQDDATPAAYALAANSLRQLAALIGEVRYMEAADRALSRARPDLERGPMAFAGIVRSLMQARSPIPQVVISGREPTRAEELKNWVQSRYSVSCYQLRATEAETTHGKQDRPLPGLLAEFRTDQAVSAWVCLGMQCLPPAHTQEDLKERLDG